MVDQPIRPLLPERNLTSVSIFNIAKWFWPTVMSISLTYESPDASCNNWRNTYFARWSPSVIRVLDSLYFLDNTFQNNPIFEYLSYTHYRFLKWLWDLDPIFCWQMPLNSEICGCSILKFVVNVLWKSSYSQKWYLRILCKDSMKEDCHIKKDKAGSTLIAVWELNNILTFVFLGFSFIVHLAHHLLSLSRSHCKYSTAISLLSELKG